ncbi:cob(I)yrinic acid a,c-diamide adenosyltransferase [Candidatus Peregrinibacteria bacterium]|nr:cob(I)yrinic acid a,c-diamide adenosyltransferase [Candidatus Peregrinibacteria bacterium]
MTVKISTKFGDKGFTKLFGGKIVAKNSAVIHFIGDLDELSSRLGEVVVLSRNSFIKNFCGQVQKDIFVMAGQIAGAGQGGASAKKRIGKKNVVYLEHTIERLEKKLPELKNFILPGGTKISANLHVCRTICRQAERFCKDKNLLPYLNRLSDALFLLARFANNCAKKSERIMR